MAWCNALTEWYNAHKGTSYSCVYFTDSGYTTPIRIVDDTGSITYPNPGGQDDPYVKTDTNGFRLPTCNESELAARYIDGTTLLYGDHASGDLTGACHDDGSILGGQSLSTVFGDYAVWFSNNPGSTMAVKSKKSNTMDLYDMSGNVSEWCFDWETTGILRVTRGGDWNSTGDNLQVGHVYVYEPYYENGFIGFRIA